MSKLNEELDVLQRDLDSLSKELPPELFNLALGQDYGGIEKFELEREIAALEKKLGFLERLLRKLFHGHYENKQYKLFRKYYEQLPPKIKDYWDVHVQFSRTDLLKSLTWILVLKKVGIFSLKTKKVREELFKIPPVEELQSQIRKLKEIRQDLSIKVLENYWFEKIKKADVAGENNVLRYLDASEKLEGYIHDYQLWKQLVSEQCENMGAILGIFPIWVVTNLSAKNSLPLKPKLFDLLVIDEASQCDIPSALPLFYRAKRVVIIGDPKQLKHIATIKESQDKRIASERGVEKLFVDFSYASNSLYELSERLSISRKKPPTLLNTHYRSHKDIIAFSNEHFYDKKLDIKTDKRNLLPEERIGERIEWDHVGGRVTPAKSPYNLDEIEETVKVLERFQKLPLKKASFGVVTLFREQTERIAKRISETPVLKNMDITVGTAHRFQGDEKDVIIFSPVVAKGIEAHTLNWIHTTTQLINVAITRARSALIIVGDKKYCFEAGGILRELAEYVDSTKQFKKNYDSEVEKILHDALVSEGVDVIPQYWTAVKDKKKYRLDFALFSNKGNWDIEVDGDKAHSQKADYDALRDPHLRLDGWKIRRFRAMEVQNNLESVVDEIKRLC